MSLFSFLRVILRSSGGRGGLIGLFSLTDSKKVPVDTVEGLCFLGSRIYFKRSAYSFWILKSILTVTKILFKISLNYFITMLFPLYIMLSFIFLSNVNIFFHLRLNTASHDQALPKIQHHQPPFPHQKHWWKLNFIGAKISGEL